MVLYNLALRRGKVKKAQPGLSTEMSCVTTSYISIKKLSTSNLIWKVLLSSGRVKRKGDLVERIQTISVR